MHRGNTKTRFVEQFSESSQNDSRVRMQDVTEGRPIMLFKVKPTGKIELNSEALDVIASIDAPVGFVSLVGKTRTGKSCLMNRLLHLNGEGVQVVRGSSGWTRRQLAARRGFGCGRSLTSTSRTTTWSSS